MAVTIQIRRDQAADWTSANPILAQGEWGFELDTNKRKIGDGITAWNTLAYYSEVATVPADQVVYDNTGSGLAADNAQDALDEIDAAVDTNTATIAALTPESRTNLLINGNFRVNQRAGTKTPGVGVYGFDRWKGHADGLEQVVEFLGAGGNATLSWVGGGNGSLNGGGLAVSPITAAVTTDTNFSAIVPATATDVQCELGDTATDFEYRPIGEELALCQRYYQFKGSSDSPHQLLTAYRTDKMQALVQFAVTMRTAPATVIESSGTVNQSVNSNTLSIQITSDTALSTTTVFVSAWTADAEL